MFGSTTFWTGSRLQKNGRKTLEWAKTIFTSFVVAWISYVRGRSRLLRYPSLPLPSDILRARSCSRRQSHISISTNQSSCATSREVWNVWNVIQNGRFRVDSVKRWKKRSLNSWRPSKSLFLHCWPTGFGESLDFEMAPLVHLEITRLRWICSESSNNWLNWDMLSS